LDPYLGPERSKNDVQKALQIVFVGSKNFRTIRNAMLGGVANAYVDRFNCFRLLHLFNNVNADYLKINIPSTVTEMPDYSELQQLPPRLIDPSQDENALVPVDLSLGNISIITDPCYVSVNRQAVGTGGTDIAAVRQEENDEMDFDDINNLEGIDGIEATGNQLSMTDHEEENDVEVDPNQLHVPLLNPAMQSSSIRPRNVPSVNTVYGNLPENVIPTTETFLIGPHGGQIGQPTRTEVMARELQALNLLLGRNQPCEIEVSSSESIARDPSAPRNANVPNVLPIESEEGDSVPMNEFTENDKIMRHSFPLLFLLGKGVPQVGGINAKWRNHTLNQYSNKFASDKSYQFLLMDQMQRHESARVVSKKIKNNPVSMQKAAEMIASSEFQENLIEPIANPGGDVAKATLRSVSSIMVGMGKSVPFTAAERADVITTMYALMQRFGLSSSFLTMSPDDTNDIIMLRLCYASTSNSTFPAQSEIDYATGKKTFKDVLDENFTENPSQQNLRLPITPVQKNMIAAMNPVATATFYIFLQKISFEKLLGISIDDSSIKKTLPRKDDSLRNPNLPVKVKDTISGIFGGNVKHHIPPLGQTLAALGVTEEQKKRPCICILWPSAL
jgi:hypothetical protein